jgi:hypothetical protein
VADVTRIREVLGWSARLDVDEMVAGAWKARLTPTE